VIGSARVKDVAASVAVGPSKDFDPRAWVYPTVQEFGSVYHQPQPFARPAFDSDGPKAIPIISGALWRALTSKGVTTTRGSGGGSLL
jgi:hypothetical protein